MSVRFEIVVRLSSGKNYFHVLAVHEVETSDATTACKDESEDANG